MCLFRPLNSAHHQRHHHHKFTIAQDQTIVHRCNNAAVLGNVPVGMWREMGFYEEFTSRIMQLQPTNNHQLEVISNHSSIHFQSCVSDLRDGCLSLSERRTLVSSRYLLRNEISISPGKILHPVSESLWYCRCEFWSRYKHTCRSATFSAFDHERSLLFRRLCRLSAA